ncbi:hypothetical protein IKS57_04565 [bacterium]|nr:hypothetical protein [bacterium]
MKYLDLAIANEQIKTTDIKGKDYAEVNQRIKAFRMVYPQGSIITDMISNIDGICVFKASVISEDGVVLATGTAYEKENSSFINKTSYIENCETSAIGRALGIAGFGIDVSVASAEEVQNAINNQVVTKEDADAYKFTFGKYKDKTIKEVYKEDDKYLEWILGNSNDDRIKEMIALVLDLKLPTEEESKELLNLLNDINDLIRETNVDREKLHNHFKVDNLNKLNKEQLVECKKILEKRLAKEQ